MRFKVPGQSVSIRLFERVETVDNQYDIFDVGIEQEDGSIDSVVVGGSFSYAKSLARQADEAHEASKAKTAKKAKVTVTAEHVQAVADAVAA
jgi:sporulation protein YlmC with PRC-barrel domain